MTDHLPECPVPAMEAGHGPLHPEDAEANCICQELRACEQRVRDELFPLRWNRAKQLEEARVNGWHLGWNAALDDGYAAGVDAAREAANAQSSKFKARDWDDAIDAALAAIDALRGES